MIVASELFKEWVKGFRSQEEAADHLGVSRQWINSIVSGASIGSEFIELVKEKTGFDFEKAFEIVEDISGKD